MEVSSFTEKLNKVDGNTYVIEEEVRPVDGVYEALLAHDNINTATLSIWTGPKLTGKRIESYVLSTPGLTPWKKSIRLYSDAPVVYISYETDGDTVEAEDINLVQEKTVETQTALNAEERRATAEEERIAADLANEMSRAERAEEELTKNLQEETARAEGAEKVLTENMQSEVSRAKAAEKANADHITAEAARAETKELELQNSIKSETSRAVTTENSIRDTIAANKPKWDDKYSRNEVDNKFSALETAIDWKEAVDTFSDIAAVYPNPEDGWTVNVKDTDYTYRWNGTVWIAISANAIPKATHSVDGLLSKEDKAAYDDANSRKHIHNNKSIIDKITQAVTDNWNMAYTHVSDTIKHITVLDRTNWNDADSKKHTHSNKSILDGITQTLMDAWNTVGNKVDKVSGKGLSANDYTTAEKTKLSGIAAGAEVNIQSDWAVKDSASDAYIKNIPSSFPPAVHTHMKSQITDMPAKLSQFTNDTGYITAADVDTSQNHTHANKTVLDKITQALMDKWNSALTALPVHTHTKSQITDFPASLPANGGTASYANYLNVNSLTANADLNTITAPGIYSCPTNATSATLNNCPSASAFFMIVGKHAGIYQELTEYAITNPKKYMRNYYNNWGNWYRVYTEANKPTAGELGAEPVFTKKSAFNKDFGSTEGSVCQGNDARLSDSRLANGGNAATVNKHTINADVPAGAKFTDTVYTHPTTSGNKHIPAGGISGQFLKWSSDGTAVWAADTNTTYDIATVSTAGLMSAGDKTKLNGIASNSNNYVHPNTGVMAGTYRSVTVNVQGHVTGGINPTTLAGYGIADAAAKNHNHDSIYIKRTHRILTLTAAGWSSSYPFSQEASVSGVLAGDDIKVIGVYVPENATLDQVKAWNKAAGYLICNPNGVAAGKITFKAYKKPMVDFQIITEGA
ncbi:hypothetical protein [Hungatella sp.]|uniref:hypothetical protein n=1 Tax=Hungatella sp. TaxID=2613924 RepID=UPI002A7EF507|nr:hypothetical protein [Hungatella sp.]